MGLKNLLFQLGFKQKNQNKKNNNFLGYVIKTNSWLGRHKAKNKIKIKTSAFLIYLLAYMTFVG